MLPLSSSVFRHAHAILRRAARGTSSSQKLCPTRRPTAMVIVMIWLPKTDAVLIFNQTSTFNHSQWCGNCKEVKAWTLCTRTWSWVPTPEREREEKLFPLKLYNAAARAAHSRFPGRESFLCRVAAMGGSSDLCNVRKVSHPMSDITQESGVGTREHQMQCVL